MCLLADNGTRVAHAQASLTIASQSVCALPVSIQQTNYMPEEEQSSSAVNSDSPSTADRNSSLQGMPASSEKVNFLLCS